MGDAIVLSTRRVGILPIWGRAVSRSESPIVVVDVVLPHIPVRAAAVLYPGTLLVLVRLVDDILVTVVAGAGIQQNAVMDVGIGDRIRLHEAVGRGIQVDAGAGVGVYPAVLYSYIVGALYVHLVAIVDMSIENCGFVCSRTG